MHFVPKQLTKSVTKHDLVYKGKKHPTEVHRLLVSALICISYDKHSQTRSIKKSLKKKKKNSNPHLVDYLLLGEHGGWLWLLLSLTRIPSCSHSKRMRPHETKLLNPIALGIGTGENKWHLRVKHMWSLNIHSTPRCSCNSK